jgi:hypothetical protein
VVAEVFRPTVPGWEDDSGRKDPLALQLTANAKRIGQRPRDCENYCDRENYDDGVNTLRDSGFEVDIKYGISHPELLEIIEKYDAIIVRSVTKVNQELIERGGNLKVAGRAGNGIDNIDVESCTQKGIIVVNTPESNTMAAGELIGLCCISEISLALAKK